MGKVFTAITVVVIYLFPVWVAIHGWRKDNKTLAIIARISFLIPFLPQLISLVAVFFIAPFHPNWNYIPKPKVYFCCGTKFFGATKRNIDRSFITSQWLRVFYLPLIPIQSYRVTYHGNISNFHGAVISTTTNYLIIENFKINVKQVVQALLFIISFIVLASLMFLFARSLQQSQNADIAFSSDVLMAAIIGLIVVYLIIGFNPFKAK